MLSPKKSLDILKKTNALLEDIGNLGKTPAHLK